jgi:hypothetical protein
MRKPKKRNLVSAPAVEKEMLASTRNLQCLGERHFKDVGIKINSPSHIATHQS